jgi:hypothetical protein
MSVMPVSAAANTLDSVTGISTERFDVAGAVEISAMPHHANPPALANDALSGLQGYLERLQKVNYETGVGPNETGVSPKIAAPGDGNLHGGPARDHLEPSNHEPTAASSSEHALTSLQESMNFALQVQSLMVEQTALVGGTSQVSHATTTLLRGE